MKGVYINVNYSGTNVDKVLRDKVTSGGVSSVYQQLAIHNRGRASPGGDRHLNIGVDGSLSVSDDRSRAH